MEDKKIIPEEKKPHVELDELALPEIKFDEKQETAEDTEPKVGIDYTGAVPEIHIN